MTDAAIARGQQIRSEQLALAAEKSQMTDTIRNTGKLLGDAKDDLIAASNTKYDGLISAKETEFTNLSGNYSE